MKSSVETTQLFDFNFVNSDEIFKVVNSLDPIKRRVVLFQPKS